jgi:hypothetical protein
MKGVLPVYGPINGPNEVPGDPVDDALRATLLAATREGQWELVAMLAGQLAKRAGPPAGIIRLADRRKQ